MSRLNEPCFRASKTPANHPTRKTTPHRAKALHAQESTLREEGAECVKLLHYPPQTIVDPHTSVVAPRITMIWFAKQWIPIEPGQRPMTAYLAWKKRQIALAQLPAPRIWG